MFKDRVVISRPARKGGVGRRVYDHAAGRGAVLMNYILGYFRNMFLSWSLAIACFLFIVPLILVPSLVLQLIKIVIPSIEVGIEQTFLYEALSNFFVAVFKNWKGSIEAAVFWILIALPFASFILSYTSRRFDGLKKNYDKFLYYLGWINIACLIFIAILSASPMGQKISSIIGVTAFYIGASWFGRMFFALYQHLRVREGGVGKRVVIIHQWMAGPEGDWRPWLKSELERLGYQVLVPQMPDMDAPVIEKWVGELSRVVGTPDKDTYFVGHSIGCQAILRYLQTIENEVGGAVFVAGWFDLENLEDDETKEIAKPWIESPIRKDAIKKVLPRSVLFISDNDPYGAFETNQKAFSEMGSKIIVLSGAGHISAEDGYEKLPEVTDALGKM